jgi:hypothetical protein
MGGHIPPTLPPAPDDPARTSIASRVWPRRRTWIVLGRTLGGFGAFIAALIAAAQFAFGGDDDDGSGRTGSTAPYVFTGRSDVSDTIRYDAPTEWGNVEGSKWTAKNFGGIPNGTPLGRKLQVAPNVSAWLAEGELDTPGVFVGVSAFLAKLSAPRALAETFNYKHCESGVSRSYHRGTLEGWETRSPCPGTGTSWVTLVARSRAEPDALVFVQAKLVDERDEAALDRILATLELG